MENGCQDTKGGLIRPGPKCQEEHQRALLIPQLTALAVLSIVPCTLQNIYAMPYSRHHDHPTMTRRGRSRDAGHARRRALRRGRPIPQFNGYEVDTVFHYEEDALRVIFPDTSMARNFSSRMQEEL